MDKTKLVEIKKGEIGSGLLIECDGYISPNDKYNKILFESLKSINEGFDGEPSEMTCPNPFIVSAVLQKYGIENANGRIYPEKILKREVEKYLQKIQEKRALGECNHPDDSVIDLSRVAINIISVEWQGHTLIGKLEIITSPAFVKYGMITCQGDQVANLLLHGIKIGVSSRGLGSVEQRMGIMYVGEDYDLIGWDVVSDPSTPGAWIGNDTNNIQQYVESKSTENKPMINEKLQKAQELLNNFI